LVLDDGEKTRLLVRHTVKGALASIGASSPLIGLILHRRQFFDIRSVAERINDPDKLLRVHGLHEMGVKPCIGRALAAALITHRGYSNEHGTPGFRSQSCGDFVTVHSGHV
jgi:hypothetical protein